MAAAAKLHHINAPVKLITSCVARTQSACAGLIKEIYSRPLPEDSTAFWVCLRRAFPDALTSSKQHELAVANVGLIYSAGYETTASAIAGTLTVLALDNDTQTSLAKACMHPPTAAPPESSAS
jgi:cytochrome P450